MESETRYDVTVRFMDWDQFNELIKWIGKRTPSVEMGNVTAYEPTEVN